MKKSITLLAILLFTVCAFGQDKSDVAIALYQKADDAFNIADYETALASLKQAEQTLGTTNTKILYLKIKTLDMLAKVDGKSATDLQLSLATFFKLADKNTYPQNKYSEILLIDVNLKQQLKEEEEAYNKVKNSNSIGSYDNFFAQYPNSKYKSTLDGKYKELQAKQKADLATKFEQQWKDENLARLKSNKAMGIGFLTTGLTSLATGIVLEGIGWNNYLNPKTIILKTETFDYDPDYVYVTEGIDKEKKNRALTMTYAGYGLIGVGAILAPLSAKFFNTIKKIKKDAKNNNINLSLYQKGNSIGLAINF